MPLLLEFLFFAFRKTQIYAFFTNIGRQKVRLLDFFVKFGLSWSTFFCLGLLGLFLIAIERLKCSKAISGRDGIGMEISAGNDCKSTALRC